VSEGRKRAREASRQAREMWGEAGPGATRCALGLSVQKQMFVIDAIRDAFDFGSLALRSRDGVWRQKGNTIERAPYDPSHVRFNPTRITEPDIFEQITGHRAGGGPGMGWVRRATEEPPRSRTYAWFH